MRPLRFPGPRPLAAAPHRASILLTLLTLVALALGASPRGASAQIFTKPIVHPFLCSPACPPPSAHISPGTESTISPTVAVTITLCDSTVITSDSVVFNGVNVTASFSSSSGTGSPGCAIKKLLTHTVTLNPGDNVLAAYVSSQGQNGTSSVTYTYTPPTYSATVTVSPTTLDAVAGQPYTTTFTITNTGNVSRAYTFSSGCRGPAFATLPCATASLTSATIPAGTDTTVTLTWTAASAGVARGWVSLTAIDGANAMAMATEQVTEYATGLDVIDANPYPSFNRGNCLIVAVSPHAASECGDFRLTHPLPTVRTYNKVRAPTLIYNWRFATPAPNFGAFLTLAPSTRSLDSVVAALYIWPHNNPSATQIGQSRSWPGADWHHDSVTTTRRIALEWGGYFSPSGYYDYAIATRRFYSIPGMGDSVAPSDSAVGHFVHVNRWASPFGSGWWLAGYEQLFINTDGLAWIGGDGSTQWYTKHVSTDSVYYPQAYVFEHDSIIYHATSTSYTRYAAHGTQILYNNVGQHIHTTDRLGFLTAFWIGSNSRIDSLLVPKATNFLKYVFVYHGDAGVADTTLDTVTAPGSRLVTFRDSLRGTGPTKSHLSITDPDNKTITFTYDPTGGGAARIISRTDKRGTVTTFGYGVQGEGLGFDSTALGGTGTDIRHRYTTLNNSSNLGQSTHAADPDSLYIEIDGPRQRAGGDSADITRVWIDRWWQPTHIRNAHGSDTYIARLDSAYPALVTRVQDPLGRIQSGVYDARGNESVITDFGVFLNGAFSATNYTFDQKWDFVTKVDPPLHDSSTFTYDTKGNRSTETDAAGNTISFSYSGVCGLLSATTLPGTPADGSLYDGTLCNLAYTHTPIGFWTVVRQDALGRVIEEISPTDSASARDTSTLLTSGTAAFHRYDAMDRDTTDSIVGPAMNGVGQQAATVHFAFDVNGAPTQVVRRARPDTAHIGAMTTQTTYDRAERPLSVIAVDGNSDNTTYDAAGNVVSLLNRRSSTTTMVYDALNQLVQRTVPSYSYSSTWDNFIPRDSATVRTHAGAPFGSDPLYGGLTMPSDLETYHYDAVGRLTEADNADAQVSRAYGLDGSLQQETLRIRTLTGTDFTKHVYTTGYGYDLEHRRISLTLPAALLADANGAVGSQETWAYDAVGRLQMVTDPQGTVFHYGYTTRGDPDTTLYPGTFGRHVSTYDADGNLRTDVMTMGAGNTVTRSVVASYDGRGKLLTSTNADGIKDALTASYSGLGAVSRDVTQWHGFDVNNGAPEVAVDSESVVMDAMGNIVADTSKPSQTVSSQNSWVRQRFQTTTHYEALTGRAIGGLRVVTSDSTRFDAAGNVAYTWVDSTASALVERASYYDAADRLREADARTFVQSTGVTLDVYTRAVEQYRYDALGRRVLVWLEAGCYELLSSFPCYNVQRGAVRRTVWDGTQELAEVQVPDSSSVIESDTAHRIFSLGPSFQDNNRYYGRVLYTHGLDVDLPLSVIRIGYADSSRVVSNLAQPAPYLAYPPISLIPVWNMHGNMETVGAPSTYTCPTDGQGHVRCALVGTQPNFYAHDQVPDTLPSWMGSLLQGKLDGTGTLYRRARALDPASGQFTQEDPIGLAGGLSAYGFAAGDPVNYGDPFGLCPPEQNGLVCIDLFIQAQSVLGLRGDGRSFNANAPASASRVQILVDPANGKASWTTSPSCIAGINACHSPRTDNSVKLTAGDDGAVTVSFSLKNSIDPTGESPSIHGSITLTPDGNGGYTSHGSTTAFPSNAVYQGVNGSWQEIHRHTETTPFDLIQGRGTDTW